ncbi:hypothetical protein BEP19_11290 [Ammoniphilus oxalaticus]|uniref:DUF2508 domain-containing protein n=1 Tax=Ammoniphilus oxalaticus TaxID=66863 RepID=A0A419SGA3_9BACL|nr:hypothetical protein [Ammoniphilus oxalaticus]RKD22822.1 hypothetical protein BEP19_11290 [Ammoniphilus oxalaticus]
MIKRIRSEQSTNWQVSNERRKLIEGAHLAMVQWQYSLSGENESDVMADILERRYMFLYETAKRRKVHALE